MKGRGYLNFQRREELRWLKKSDYCVFFVFNPKMSNRQKVCSLICQKFSKRKNNWIFRHKRIRLCRNRRRNPEYWESDYEDYMKSHYIY